MQKRSLELSCYILGAGAFGVFLRWLQDQLAFDDNGLAERSVFHILVPLFILTVGFVFLRFVDNIKNKRFYLPEDYCEAFENKGRLFAVARWTLGVIMCVGAVILLATCEVEKEANFLRVLAVLAFLSGISFPILLTAANHSPNNYNFLSILSSFPILLFAVWLITSYKINDINSVVWSFSIEIITVILAMLAFFRIAGFAFGAPNVWRSLFMSMFSASMCIMTLADTRNLGMQVIIFAAAMMMVMYNWIMIKNLRYRSIQREEPVDDGFERL